MNANALTPALRRAAAALFVASLLALAATPGGAAQGRPATRNTTRTNINSGNRTNVNVNTGNRTSVNVNTRHHTDVDVHVHGGYYGGGYYHPGPSVGAVVATAIVVGAIVSSLPPSCTTIIANGFAYQNCGGTYYQPRYSGSSVTYVVVSQP
jgi:hypothetical protein